MKPKRNYTATMKKTSPLDACATPCYALDPLLPFLPRRWKVWEPFAGEGRLVRHLERAGYTVRGSTIEHGENFFDLHCENCDVLVSNPPYGCKFDVIERCYALGMPFALLLPVEALGSQRAQRAMQHGVEILLLNRRVNFHMPKIGFDNSSAQFPVIWLCHNILPNVLCYGEIIYRPEPDGEPV